MSNTKVSGSIELDIVYCRGSLAQEFSGLKIVLNKSSYGYFKIDFF